MMALVDMCNSSLLHTLTMRVMETGRKGVNFEQTWRTPLLIPPFLIITLEHMDDDLYSFPPFHYKLLFSMLR